MCVGSDGGVDEDEFVIDDGELRFKDPKPLQGACDCDSAVWLMEAGYIPTYDNSGNEYQVVVRATDESGLQTQEDMARQ